MSGLERHQVPAVEAAVRKGFQDHLAGTDPMARELEDLAQELEAMVAHSLEVWEAAEGDVDAVYLLEDLEARVLAVARALRGRPALPHTYAHPMPKES